MASELKGIAVSFSAFTLRFSLSSQTASAARRKLLLILLNWYLANRYAQNHALIDGKDSVVEISYGRALWRNFLGQSPDWYKLALIIFLIVNPLVFAVAPFVAGWLLVVEFIFTPPWR